MLVFLLSVLGIFSLLFFSLILFLHSILPPKKKFSFQRKHALVTGGSKGIGRAIAVELLTAGCSSVTIVARNPKKACDELQKYCSLECQKVYSYALDVTESFDKISNAIDQIQLNAKQPIDLLVNNAGSVTQGPFEELSTDAFEQQMRINFFSAVNFTKAVLTKGNLRHVAFVSSAAGQCAIWGYTAYSPSKFALRAFAEALYSELLPKGVGVSILYPPNTATEGFDEELKTMPEEIREISSSAGLFTANEVAQRFIADLRTGRFSTTIGLDGWMLGTLSAGSAPETSIFSAFSQIALGGLLRAVMLFYLDRFNRIVLRCNRNRAKRVD